MASLDTNCLLRWFLNDIPEQRQRVERLIGSGEALTVDDVVVIEAVFALESGAKLSRETISGFLGAAMTYPLLIDRTLWTEVLRTWTGHPKLSIVDVYLATKTARAGKGPVYTFDTKMVNQLEPAQAVPPLP
ncbi:MAG: PIN domain-containing protein [Propionibacteriaceae bacterium]|nr:PIN domain-containing protein [Propionibacteriaceae bacterium]